MSNVRLPQMSIPTAPSVHDMTKQPTSLMAMYLSANGGLALPFPFNYFLFFFSILFLIGIPRLAIYYHRTIEREFGLT